MESLIVLLYGILGSIAVWPLSLFLRRHPNFRGTLLQRLGLSLPDIPAGRRVLWVHAASVGEVKAVAGLVSAVRDHSPDMFVCMSCMTATGREVAARTRGIDLVFPFPFDVPWAMRRHVLRIMPVAVLIVETEIWPAMILSARRLSIPVVFVNARMSVRAHERYVKLAGVFGQLLAGVKVFAMSGEDAQRFRSIGARDAQVLGNLKLDLVASGDKALSEALRRELCIGDRPVFIAGSVREGEEQPVVDAIIRITTRIPDLYSIIAPRHPDRVQYIADMAAGLGIRWGLRSRGATGQDGIDLLIVDTMGELFTLYGISDAAFVGGSLLNLGGQNILEPIAWGVPTLHGKSMDNFVWALDAVKGLTTTVKDARGLADAVMAMLMDRKASRARGLEAREALRSSRGVTERYLHALEPYLGRASSLQ